MTGSESNQKLFYLEEVKANKQSETEEMKIDLVDFFYYVLQKIKYVVLLVAIGAGATFAYSFFLATPVYKATAELYVVNSKDSVINLSDLQIGSYLANDYQLVFKTWEVNTQVIENLNLPYTAAQMEKMLSVTNPSNTRALFITISSSNPNLAANIANEYAAVASDYISQTMDIDAPRILSTAIAPSEPDSPNKALNMIIGSVGSLILSLMILLVSFLRNDKVVTDEDIFKYTGVSTLVVIPDTNAQVKKQKSIFKKLKLRRSRGKKA